MGQAFSLPLLCFRMAGWKPAPRFWYSTAANRAGDLLSGFDCYTSLRTAEKVQSERIGTGFHGGNGILRSSNSADFDPHGKECFRTPERLQGLGYSDPVCGPDHFFDNECWREFGKNGKMMALQSNHVRYCRKPRAAHDEQWLDHTSRDCVSHVMQLSFADKRMIYDQFRSSDCG